MPVTVGEPPAPALAPDPAQLARPAKAGGWPNPATGGLVYSGHCVLMGWAVYETTGVASATLTILDGTDTLGANKFTVALTAGQSDRDWFGPWGIEFRAGLFMTIATGSISGVLMYIPFRNL